MQDQETTYSKHDLPDAAQQTLATLRSKYIEAISTDNMHDIQKHGTAISRLLTEHGVANDVIDAELRTNHRIALAAEPLVESTNKMKTTVATGLIR